MQKIRVFEAFAGYGSQAIAAKRLQQDFPNDVEFEFVGISEIEPTAIKAYNAIHGDTICYGDISKIDWAMVPDFDLFTYSFPCQDISNAGKQKGFSEGSGSRSSLLWECERAIKEKRPKYLLMENVKALIQKKFMPDFQRWIDLLETYGYKSFWQVLNAKDFGVAQNRERVFMISILRTPDNPNPTYNFPKGFPLTKTVEDYMVPPEEVDESYFISQDRVTNKVLKDILDQPNVRAEMEKLYHEEWKERMMNKEGIVVDTCPADKRYLFESSEWERYEEGSGNLANHFDVFRITIKDGEREISEELRIDVWYRPVEMYPRIIAEEVDRLTKNYPISNRKELEDKILKLLYEKYFPQQ